MDEEMLPLAAGILGPGSTGHLAQADAARRTRTARLRSLLAQRSLPSIGWSDHDIEWALSELAGMDSNQFAKTTGVGEREGRVVSSLVARRHYGFSHGIGRSGDLMEVQPKAAGSSLLHRLTNALACHALRIAGATAHAAAAALVVPVATGMAITLCLSALREQRPLARYVIWPRIDQKSAFKAILAAGLVPIVVENRLDGDAVCTDLEAIRAAVKRVGVDQIVAILTTTSCFAPRIPDDLYGVAKLCIEYDLPQLVNNAYGVQSRRCMNAISNAALLMKTTGAPMLTVQSTDKNFLVPVGGAVISGYDASWVARVAQAYPGRASITPILDLFITLLSLGETGYKKLLRDRKPCYAHLQSQLSLLASELGTRVLSTRRNDISIAFALPPTAKDAREQTALGAKLFARRVTGARVVTGMDSKTIGTFNFTGYGAHIDMYSPLSRTATESHANTTPEPVAYLTAAAAIGMTNDQVDRFILQLRHVLTSIQT